MFSPLPQSIAQRIVDMVKEVCGYDINFIDTTGTIFASTDNSRIGDFHEIGYRVSKSQKTIEVTSDNSFYGTRKGVNIPFTYNGETIAVIGISGNPDEVRRYAILAQTIANMLLKERDLDLAGYNMRNQINYFLHSLFENRILNRELLDNFLAVHHLSREQYYRTIILRFNSQYNFSNISTIEPEIYQLFNRMPRSLYTFIYPGEYWLLLSNNSFHSHYDLLRKAAKQYQTIFYIGIGCSESLSHISRSYKTAEIAAKNCSPQNNIINYDDLTLEIIVGSLSADIKDQYKRRTITSLCEADLQLLQIYFSTNLSLQKTSELLFLHKNTVQYKLNRINKLTGLNPRNFVDAVALYIALNI